MANPFLAGFIKRAADYSVSEHAAMELYKKAAKAAPTLEELKAAYPAFAQALTGSGIDARSYKTPKQIVKDVPIVSAYGEVLDAGKKQNLGFLRRHLYALMSRPSVWGGSNAFFVPKGPTGFIISPEKINEAVLKHELGHAEDYARLGGEEGFDKEYGVPFLTRLTNPRETALKSVLLPEARAWHYAGLPVSLAESAKAQPAFQLIRIPRLFS